MKIIKKNIEKELEVVHKISFQLNSYYNNKLLTISEDEVFFTLNFSDELNKFKKVIEINNNPSNRNIGSLSFNLAYKTEFVNEDDVKKRMDKLHFLFSVNNQFIFRIFSPRLNLIKTLYLFINTIIYLIPLFVVLNMTLSLSILLMM